MELNFLSYETNEELLHMDLFYEGEKVAGPLYDWPYLPRKGETINLRYKVQGENAELYGVVQHIQWESIGGYLNVCDIYIRELVE